MENNRKRKILTVLALILQETNESSSSESDDEELDMLERMVNKRRKVSRVRNYVEEIVPALTDEEFKAHFR